MSLPPTKDMNGTLWHLAGVWFCVSFLELRSINLVKGGWGTPHMSPWYIEEKSYEILAKWWTKKTCTQRKGWCKYPTQLVWWWFVGSFLLRITCRCFFVSFATPGEHARWLQEDLREKERQQLLRESEQTKAGNLRIRLGEVRDCRRWWFIDSPREYCNYIS